MEVSHCGNRDLRHFCSCDFDPDPVTFTRMHRPKMILLREGFRKLSPYTEIIYYAASRMARYMCTVICMNVVSRRDNEALVQFVDNIQSFCHLETAAMSLISLGNCNGLKCLLKTSFALISMK